MFKSKKVVLISLFIIIAFLLVFAICFHGLPQSAFSYKLFNNDPIVISQDLAKP